MALALLEPEPVAVLPPSPVELNLLLAEPGAQPRSHWTKILAGSIGLHFVFFLLATKLPSFVAGEPEPHRVIVKRTALYFPRDLVTQRAPNRDKLSRSIDLNDLLSTPSQQARQAAAGPSRRRFELPQQPIQQPKTAPQILPEAPALALNQPPGTLPPGATSGLPNPPKPAPSSAGPFENIGSDTPPPAHPALTPPKASVQSAVNSLAQSAAGQKMVITDDSASEPRASLPGMTAQPGSQHSAVELKSDPQGADFKPYLIRILSIVRANWKRVIPASARMGTLRGRAVVEFVISRDGSIPKMVMADSSGLDPLDRAAIAGLSMSNPLPPLPADFKGGQVRLAFTFSYNMPTQ